MSGKRLHFDTSIFTKPPPNFKLPPNPSYRSPNSFKKRESSPEKQSAPAKSLVNGQGNYKNNSSAILSQKSPQYVLTATQSFMMTPMNNVQVVQKPPSSLPIQNSPMAIDPSYYAFYYDPKSTSGYTPASTAFASATPVSYSPSLEQFSVPLGQYPPPLPPVPPPQNPPPPPLPPTSSPAYRSAYSPTSQYTQIPPQYSSTAPQYTAHTQYSPSTAQYSPTTPKFNLTTPQYSPTTSQFSPTTPQYPSSLSKPAYYKRTAEPEDYYKKNMRKKKKPLSQNIPQRKDWSVEDAKRALEVEKDCNKRNKRQSLIIKFPDLELNRLIVANFHKSIDSVHFQQPSTPRFCFVTLEDSADPETVIQHLNQIPFGQGFLTAEFKKDREDEINIGPEDIDPLTLYVGNLAQDVTKEDMVKAYPRQKRIDIGYAKKMKYTRYAFVSFKTVDDSIEAFQSTHATQMYSKSLIVRFRRLHGTVGMPGEPKPPPHNRNDAEALSLNNLPDEKEPDRELVAHPWDIDISRWEEDSPIKEEHATFRSEDELDTKPSVTSFRSKFMPGSADITFTLHTPKAVLVKPEGDAEDDAEGSPPPSITYALPRPLVDVKTEADVGEASSTQPPLTPTTKRNVLIGIGGAEIGANVKEEEENKPAQRSSDQLTMETATFPMPISVKNEIIEDDNTVKPMEQDTTSSIAFNEVDVKLIKKLFTPISVKMEFDDGSLNLGVSSIQNEYSQLNDDKERTNDSGDMRKGIESQGREQESVDTKNGDSIIDEGKAVESEAVKINSLQQKNQVGFRDWINVAPTIKSEPVEEDDMVDGVDSSEDDDFSFSHIMKSKVKKTKRTNRSVI